MASLNLHQVIGYVGKDPEIKYLQNGDPVCNFSVATSESWKDKQGQKQERTEWHRIVAWRKLAEICGQYLSKGKQVYVSGKSQSRKWKDKDGNERTTVEIQAQQVVFLGKGDGEARPKAAAPATAPATASDDSGPPPQSDEDVPF
jgi:single-strand DNA-binding protein